MCARVSSKKRGKRDQRWYLFLSLHLYHSAPRLPPSLASLIPLFPRLSQENYNLTAHFNISASKWVWQALLCVAPSSVPTAIHPPRSLPAPTSLCRLLIVSPRRFNFYHVTGEGEREGEMEKKNKNKSGSNRGRFARLSGCLSLSSCEFPDTYTTMNLQWGEVSLRPDVRRSCSGLDAHRQCFRVTGRVVISSAETDIDSE